MGTAERFWSKVEKGPGCWTWLAGPKHKLYGLFWTEGRDVGAHRMAYMLVKGPIPEGALIMHSCDNPRCVNPDHLSAGNYFDNNRDTVTKGRRRNNAPRGTAHNRSKFSESEIRYIRSIEMSVTNQSIADQFGVDNKTIWKIRRGLSWKHVT